MFTWRVVVYRPRKHLIFSFSPSNANMWVNSSLLLILMSVWMRKPILGMSWWHPNCILLTHLPFRSCCHFTEMPLGALQRKCLPPKNLGFDQSCFPLHFSSGTAGSLLSQQIDTVTTDSPKNQGEILFLLSLHSWFKTLSLKTASHTSARVLTHAPSSSGHLAVEALTIS